MITSKNALFVTFLYGMIYSGYCFLDDSTQTNTDMLHRLVVLENRTQYLEKDIILKNDLTQFLKGSVVALNTSLTAERAKTTTLEATVADLEKRLRNQVASSGELAGDVKSASNLAKSLKTELDMTKQDVQSQNTTIQSLNNAVQHSMNQVDQQLAMVNGNITTLQQSLALANHSPHVYFTYRSADANIPTNETQPLKFHGRITNQGNAFNAATGEFVAPIAGVYWFSLTLGVSTSEFLNCYIVQNTHLYLVEVYASTYSAFTSASSSVNVFLNKGETMSVAGCKGNGTISSYKSSFTGMLVYED